MALDSDVSFKWTKPIVFSPAFADAFHELVGDFQKRLIAQVVTEAGQNPSNIRSSEAARALFEASEPRNFELYSLGDNIERLEQAAWSAELRDDTIIGPITTAQLLRVPNAGSQIVTAAKLKVWGHRKSVSVNFSTKGFREGVQIDFSGSFDQVQQFRRELEDLLAAHSQPWALVRHSNFSWVILSIILMCAYCGIQLMIAIAPNLSAISLSISTIPAIFVGSMIFLIIPYFIGAYHERLWRWLFPSVTFDFGGNIPTEKLRQKLRYGLWSVPIFAVLLPIVTSKIADAIR